MKWLIFAHGDSDGVASAALAKAYLEQKGYRAQVVFTHPVGLLSDIKEFTRDYCGVFIVDVALSEVHRDEILSLLKELATRCSVVYVDHHPLLEDINVPGGLVWVHDTCCSSSELVFRFLRGKGLNAEYSRVGLYGAIGDYLDETPWVKRELSNWDKRSVYLEAGILIQGIEGSRRDYEFKRRVVEHLSKNKLPSTMNELVEKSLKQAVEDENLRMWVKNNVVKDGLIAYVLNPPGSAGKSATYARIYGNAKVGIAIEERKEVYVMSLRGEQGVDLNRILRELSRTMGIDGGGHPLAAGARVKKELFTAFLDELSKRVCGSRCSPTPCSRNCFS